MYAIYVIDHLLDLCYIVYLMLIIGGDCRGAHHKHSGHM